MQTSFRIFFQTSIKVDGAKVNSHDKGGHLKKKKKWPLQKKKKKKKKKINIFVIKLKLQVRLSMQSLIHF